MSVDESRSHNTQADGDDQGAATLHKTQKDAYSGIAVNTFPDRLDQLAAGEHPVRRV
jgi:hypothetical protein